MRHIAALLLAVVLTACGGGGPNAGTCNGSPEVCNPSSGGGGFTPVTPPVTEQSAEATANGIWKGSTNTGRTTVGVFRNNGEAWVLYSVANNPNIIAGAALMTINTSGTSITGSGTDYNLEGQGITSATVTGSFVSKTSLALAVRYPNSTVTATGAYDPSFDTVTGLDIIAGTYAWQVATTSGPDSGTLTVSNTGAVAGSSVRGCRFQGTVSPSPNGNIYDITMISLGGCAAETATGIAYYDAAERKMWAAGLNPSRTAGMLAVGTKQ